MIAVDPEQWRLTQVATLQDGTAEMRDAWVRGSNGAFLSHRAFQLISARVKPTVSADVRLQLAFTADFVESLQREHRAMDDEHGMAREGESPISGRFSVIYPTFPSVCPNSSLFLASGLSRG